MPNDSSSDVAASEPEDERSITAVADGPAVTRERAPEVQAGDVLAGRYQVEALIGKGGSGIVLRAFDRVSATVVAVKVLKSALTHDPRWDKRFSRELRLGRPIRHPNVCRIFDIGEADGYRFLTMEYATRGTLRDLIKKNQPLRPLSDRLEDAGGVIAGLAAIHEAGIVHRDVKPDNMLRTEDGRLVLSDFGLATDLPDSTMVSVFVGTPHYMAPEVREGDPATTRSDVWSLGVVLHEIFTGRRPERRNSRSGASQSRTSATKTSSTVERAMLALCERCLSDDPADRPEDARAVQRLFESTRRSPYAILRSHRKRVVAFGIVGAVIVALGVGIGATMYRRSQRSVVATPEASRMVPVGEPADWSRVARQIATVPGHVHCFSIVEKDRARIVWGTPRRGEELHLNTGERRPSDLLPETFAIGCPEQAPRGEGLLFTARNSAGATEVRLASTRNGLGGRAITPGFAPLWLPNGEEFVYNIDAAHAAVFSLTTASFNLLRDTAGNRGPVLEKAVGASTGEIALLLGSSDADWTLAVYGNAAVSEPKALVLPSIREIRFDPVSRQILASSRLSRKVSALIAVDWSKGSARNLGQYPDLDFRGIQFAGDRAVFVGRKLTKDAWVYERGQRRQVTFDGENYSAGLSATGDLLLGKRDTDGSLSIWSQSPGHAALKVSRGPLDVEPEFSSDGSAWAYADYAQKSIMLCSWATKKCRAIAHDEMLPAWPRFSPDGTKIAYVTQVNPAHLAVVSIEDGRVKSLGSAYWQCPPVWSSSTKLWTFEGSGERYFWSERKEADGSKTGKTVDVGRGEVNTSLTASDDVECWPPDPPVDSPFFRKVRIEAQETATFFAIPRASVH